MSYTDEKLQQHELDYWMNGHKMPFHHEKFYKQFFDFTSLKGKTVLEFGCGGCPISEYTDADFDRLILVDPLIRDIINHSKYSHLESYELYSQSILNLKLKEKVDVIVGLNVIDHFNDQEYSFINNLFSLLNSGGELWLYYDIRTESHSHHLAIDNEKILNKIKQQFNIIKIDDTINPTHINWSKVEKSIRLIAKKK